MDFVIEIGETGGFACYRIGIGLVTHYDWGAAQFVAGCYDAFFGKQKQGAGTFHLVVNILNAFHDGLALDDEHGYQFGGICVA